MIQFKTDWLFAFQYATKRIAGPRTKPQVGRFAPIREVETVDVAHSLGERRVTEAHLTLSEIYDRESSSL